MYIMGSLHRLEYVDGFDGKPKESTGLFWGWEALNSLRLFKEKEID